MKSDKNNNNNKSVQRLRNIGEQMSLYLSAINVITVADFMVYPSTEELFYDLYFAHIGRVNLGNVLYLCALEGARNNIDIFAITKSRKAELQQYLDDIKAAL